jgi:hypothetical protein
MTTQELVDALAEIHPDLAEWARVRVKENWTTDQLIGRLRVLTMYGEKGKNGDFTA